MSDVATRTTHPSSPLTIWSTWPIALSFTFFSLFDFYVPGVNLRPLDFLGLFVLLVWVLWDARGWHGLNVSKQKLISLVLLSLVSALLVTGGLLENLVQNFKIGIGFVLGTAVFVASYIARIQKRQLLRITTVLLVANATYLIVQLVFFELTGRVLNLYSFVGAQPRALSDIFRPTGLFLEPASYSLVVLMMLVLRTRLKKRLDRVSYLAIASIFMTVSLWGFVASFVFLGCFKWKDWRFWAVTISVFVVLFYFFGSSDAVRQFQLYRRLAGLAPDTSREVRFAGLLSAFDQRLLPVLFGKGVSNDYLELGSNGLSFLLSAGGLLGTLAFLLLLNLLAPRGRRIQTMLFVGLFMSAAPFWPYFYWWAWLGLYLRDYSEPDPAHYAAMALRPDARMLLADGSQ